MKHVYTTGGTENLTTTQQDKEVVINEVDTQYRAAQRPWKDINTSRILPGKGTYEKPGAFKFNREKW